jgi:hypothetical protein
VDQTRPILIACPQHRILVRGTYACDGSGQYLFDAEGNFRLDLVKCGQYGGRCMQTLCALHRFNRNRTASWYPERILAAPQSRPRRPGPRHQPNRMRANNPTGLSHEA